MRFSNGRLNYMTIGMKTDVGLFAVFVEIPVLGLVVAVVMYITTLSAFGMQKQARVVAPIVDMIKRGRENGTKRKDRK